MRDMGLNNFRKQWEAFLNPLVSRLGFLDPNHVSWFSLLITGAACYMLATAGTDHDGGIRLLYALGLVMVASACDTIDGTIARKFNKETAYGDFLDHTIDRIVDFLLIVAIGVNAAWMTTPHLGYAAALLTFLGSYMGTQAQSVGLGRNYGGFGRADRLVVTLLGIILAIFQALTQTWLNVTIPIINTPLNALSAILLISLIGGVSPFVIRFLTARSELLESENAPHGGDSARNDEPDDS